MWSRSKLQYAANTNSICIELNYFWIYFYNISRCEFGMLLKMYLYYYLMWICNIDGYVFALRSVQCSDVVASFSCFNQPKCTDWRKTRFNMIKFWINIIQNEIFWKRYQCTGRPFSVPFLNSRGGLNSFPLCRSKHPKCGFLPRSVVKKKSSCPLQGGEGSPCLSLTVTVCEKFARFFFFDNQNIFHIIM